MSRIRRVESSELDSRLSFASETGVYVTDEDGVEPGDLLWTGTYFSELTRFGMAMGEDIVKRLGLGE